MTDLSTLRIDQPGQVISAIGSFLSGKATDWWQANSSAAEGDVRTLAAAAAQTATALAQGRITKETAEIAFAAQRRVLEQTPMFIEFMAAAGAQSALDGVFNILGTAIQNVTGFNPFFIPPG